ncbi:MAG: hypothetical protein OER95_11470, partial [Acidimicrobiia bacterium]|nr:hypothetical protein [Acidimicrobiia bacterium]
MTLSWLSPEGSGAAALARLLRLVVLVFVVSLTAACSGDDGAPASGDGVGADATSEVISNDTEAVAGAESDDGDGQTASGIGAERRREVKLGLTDWTGSRINLAIAEL